MNKRFFLFVFLYVIIYLLPSQINDSIDFYINISTKYQATKPDIAFFYAVKAKKLADLQGDSTNILKSLQNLADVYWYSNKINKALETYLKILKVADSSKFTSFYGYALYGIGWIECVQKNKIEKMHYLKRACNIFKLIKDTINYSFVINGLEDTYLKMYKSDTNRKDYLEKSIEYNFIGRKFINSNPNFKIILLQYDLSLGISLIEKKLFDSVYKIINKIEKNHTKSKLIQNLLYRLKFKYYFSTRQLDSCYNLVLNHENKFQLYTNENKIEYYELKYNVLKNLKKYKEAIQCTDSLVKIYPLYFNELIIAKAEDFEYNQNILKKELSIKHLNEKNTLEMAKNKQKNFFLILTSFAFLMALIFLLNTINQKKKIQQLNSNLENQKFLLEEKNHEITQSISYASRIQKALLKQNEALSEIKFIKDTIILFIPKDIVSGDFYWIFKSLNNAYYIGVFDCTGHGVPGSFVSLMNLNILQESVKVMNLVYPNEILNYVRTRIIQLLNLDESQKDGMDGVLFYFPENFEKSRKAFYAAANTPAYLIDDKKIIQTPFDKMPVGKSSQELPFQKFHIEIPPGLKIYFSSDGFKDQFGGPNNKRMGSKKFRELLLNLSNNYSLNEQKSLLFHYLNEWKGTNEQTDDICILGIEC